VAELMAGVGLSPNSARRFPSQFSGGQRQRIVLARALAASPTAFVLDEPFASLDASSQAQIMGLLADLRAREQIAMLLISHDLGVVRQTADVVAVMYLGRIVEVAATEALWDRPLHPYTSALIDAIPSVSEVGKRPEPLSGEVPDPSDPPSGCPFHTRCPHAFDRCKSERPPLVATEAGREVACWLHEPPA
jgi:peptide/nickel transport system ATP-binding protein